MQRDLHLRLSAAQSLGPVARTATASGSGVDTKGFEGAAVVISTGTITDGSHVLKLQESVDNSVFTDVAAADLDGAAFPTLTNSGFNNKTYLMGYKGIQRYLRVVSTVSGATTGGVYEAMMVLGYPRHQN